MSIPIALTPILNGKNARRFDRLVKQGLKNPVEFVPTPRIEEAKKRIAKEPEIDYKKAFEMAKEIIKQKPWYECSQCIVKNCKENSQISCSQYIIYTILKQCTEGGELK